MVDVDLNAGGVTPIPEGERADLMMQETINDQEDFADGDELPDSR
jgi:hypothetical protein